MVEWVDRRVASRRYGEACNRYGVVSERRGYGSGGSDVQEETGKVAGKEATRTYRRARKRARQQGCDSRGRRGGSRHVLPKTLHPRKRITYVRTSFYVNTCVSGCRSGCMAAWLRANVPACRLVGRPPRCDATRRGATRRVNVPFPLPTYQTNTCHVSHVFAFVHATNLRRIARTRSTTKLVKSLCTFTFRC